MGSISTRCGPVATAILEAFGAGAVLDMAFGLDRESADGFREVCRVSGRWREAGSMSGMAMRRWYGSWAPSTH